MSDFYQHLKRQTRFKPSKKEYGWAIYISIKNLYINIVSLINPSVEKLNIFIIMPSHSSIAWLSSAVALKSKPNPLKIYNSF